MGASGEQMPRRRLRRASLRRHARRGVLLFIALLVIEYLVVPRLVGAGKNLHILRNVRIEWLIAGTALEAVALLCYALLTRTLLLDVRPSLFRLYRIVLATSAVTHLIPGGAAGGAGLGYQLLTSSGVAGADAGFVLATQAVGSAVVLNVLLWVALLVSIPMAGLHPIYVVIALVGVLALLGASALVYTFTRGGEHAVRFVRAVGRHVPRVGADRLERVVRAVGESLVQFGRQRVLLRRAVFWAAMNWLLDAASLWAFVAAFGYRANFVELFAAYGIANVLAVIPLTPGGLGVVEATAATLLISFGLPNAVATLGVLAWRLVNFWLPIPLGALAYLSLTLGGSRAREASKASAAAAPVPQPDPPVDRT